MYKGKSIVVVIPAYNEEALIGRVIEGVPDYVDTVLVVDDFSRDKTAEIVKGYRERMVDRIVLIQHEKNRGVGGAVASGYAWVRDKQMDIAVVMNGDAQMDPMDLPRLLDPIAEGDYDYVKGNRLFTGEAWRIIPKYRYIGNAVLSLLTKIASGYWHVADSQSGYTAASLRVLQTLDLKKIYPRYGMPNDILVRLNVFDFHVRDVPVLPIYGIGEKSGFAGVRIFKVIVTISALLLRLFLLRLKEKYIVRDFHPLVFFYLMAGIALPLGLYGLGRTVYFYFLLGKMPTVSLLLTSFFLISGLQSLFFAMWFDMESNKDLKNAKKPSVSTE